jgi:hypothetical protein
MKVITELIQVQQPRLYLPWVHRIAPSCRTNTILHGVLRPGGDGRQPELFLSPFPTSSWTDLWCLECEFIDRPGIVADLTALLGDPRVHVNLLAHEITTIGHGTETLGHVNLICDMTAYGDSDNPDRTTQDRRHDPDARLQYLLDYLTIEFWKDLRFHQGRPQVFATRLRELQLIGTLVHDCALRPFTVAVRRGIIELPDYLWKQAAHGSERPGGKHLLAVASDTEERYLKITPLPAGQDYFILEVRHHDHAGQVAGFTRLLRSEFPEVNLVGCYLRLREAGGEAIWRCLLGTSSGDSARLTRKLAEAFARARDQLGDPTLSVCFPAPVSEHGEPGWKSNGSRPAPPRQRPGLLDWLRAPFTGWPTA